jgi:hypothetical protein
VRLSNVQQFSEIINGRTYHIEVARITCDRWRAHIVRAPGLPTALMPFYGPTAVDAARTLAEWLVKAHRGAQPARAAES